MEYILNQKSILLENWKLTLLFTTFVTVTIYIVNKTKEGKIKQLSNLNKISESEYVGEINFNENNYDDLLTPSIKDAEHVIYEKNNETIGDLDQYYRILNNRRSIRKFSSKPVNFEIIKKCIQIAGTSPSGAHTEPWTFCVIENCEIKTQIREIIESEELINYNKRMSRQWTTDLQPFKTNYIKEYLTDAPYLILIFKQIYGFRDDGKQKQHYYNEISVSIATGILLCALQYAGLNTLVTTPLNCGPALKHLLKRPINEKLLVLIPVGFAADDCTVPNLQRKDVNDIFVKY